MLNVRIFDPARPSSRTRGGVSLRIGEGGSGITPGNGVSPIRHSRNQAPVMNLGAARPDGRWRPARKRGPKIRRRRPATWQSGRDARVRQDAPLPGIRHHGTNRRSADDSSSFCRRFHE